MAIFLAIVPNVQIIVIFALLIIIAQVAYYDIEALMKIIKVYKNDEGERKNNDFYWLI